MPAQERQSRKAINLLIPYVNSLHAISKDLRTGHANWVQYDVRITVFRKCASTGINTIVHLSCREKYIGFAPKPYVFPGSPETQAHDLMNLDMSVKLCFFLTTFIAIESSLRYIFRVLWPNDTTCGTGPFFTLSQRILKELDLMNHEDLFGVLCTSRNAIHNNMAHFNSSRQDKTFSYQGRTYSFVCGKVIDWMTWEALIDLMNLARLALRDVVYSPKILQIDEIADTVIVDR